MKKEEAQTKSKENEFTSKDFVNKKNQSMSFDVDEEKLFYKLFLSKSKCYFTSFNVNKTRKQKRPGSLDSMYNKTEVFVHCIKVAHSMCYLYRINNMQ